ncbi:MAG: ATPase [Gemmatimonas sp.]|nr:ATPase [Gemmatimonas sp.]
MWLHVYRSPTPSSTSSSVPSPTAHAETSSPGWWRYLAITPHQQIDVEDGFADEHGTPNTDMPSMRMSFFFESTATGSRFRSVTRLHSLDAMEQLVAMGMMEGMRSAMSQIDDVLADLTTFAAERGTHAQLLNDTTVRVSRVVRGTPAQVWRAHQEPACMQRWLTGPDGWTMPVCEVAKAVGDRYRYEWASADGAQRFGFEGALLESHAPHRAVTTEQMVGTDGPATRNELTLVPVQGGTLLCIVITYPSTELRNMILGTGMTVGMEASYARLEQELAAA